MLRTSDSKPEMLPIFINSLVQTKFIFVLLKIFMFSFASNIKETKSKTQFTSILEYPIPFTPRFKDIGKFDISKVSNNTLNIILVKVRI